MSTYGFQGLKEKLKEHGPYMPKAISRFVCLSSEVQELSSCLAMTSILSRVLFPFVRSSSMSRLASQLGGSQNWRESSWWPQKALYQWSCLRTAWNVTFDLPRDPQSPRFIRLNPWSKHPMAMDYNSLAKLHCIKYVRRSLFCVFDGVINYTPQSRLSTQYKYYWSRTINPLLNNYKGLSFLFELIKIWRSAVVAFTIQVNQR